MAKSKSKHHKARKTRLAQAATERPQPTQASFLQEQKRGGLLVTDELQKALEECKTRVTQIAADCRRRNRKFRDNEFDLEFDRSRCLHGLPPSSDFPGPRVVYTPSDVQRATQIFENPSFFINGADSNDIVQGALGDCWFLSALATMSTAKGLVEKFCVARDEQIGVYGFIFFRDTAWVTVIIDDLLFTSIPKFEELNHAEKQLYHHDKETYNKSARKSGKSLYFAKSGTNGETWVPLIEKAYAKLHGNYAALSGGEAGEAIEDLTGGVTSFIFTKDILDIDKFWNEELLRANQDRLFGCAFDNLDSTRSGDAFATVNGLMGGHAYSVLRAVEYKGKRFVVIRNPWGRTEWTGPWSDGSKEWTPEWLPALQALGHSFGDDGEFIMEYKDFLENWDQIDRTLLFDSSWAMSSQWLKVTTHPLPSAWGFGDVSFTISLPTASEAVIVLSKLDERYFQPISGRCRWSFDFVIFRKAETQPIVTSSPSLPYSRSVNAEIFLEAGDYVVHVRLDRDVFRPPNYLEKGLENWKERDYARVLTEKAKSQSIASNFNRSDEAHNLPIPLDVLAGQDLSVLEAKAAAAAEKLKKEQEALKRPSEMEQMTATDTPPTEPATAPASADAEGGGTAFNEEATLHPKGCAGKGPPADEGSGDDASDSNSNEGDDSGEHDKEEGSMKADARSDDGPPHKSDPAEDDVVFLGLRVYTKKASPATVGGQLRHEMATSFAGLAIEHL
ncbi:putative peptidase C2 family protein [Lyophyllum shimeji]|uniref:Peptidase C2 family protein n=1 Tax=Lyophyllum shimeji TaxID=47721 RepID=A0A9P3UPW8_LYOSH|nr:putative peptidase C2 family protein [Lyophyllum shimeji]